MGSVNQGLYGSNRVILVVFKLVEADTDLQGDPAE